MFIAALFIIVKTWKQPNYAWTYEWIKMWYKYTKKKKSNNAICSNMPGFRDYHNK